MKFTDDNNLGPKLNMTSLIDVVFLLLIFFMVTTTFEKQSKLKIELPEATEKIHVQTQEQIIISISQKGNIYLNNNELLNSQYDSIATSLKAMLTGDEKPPVVIRADANAAHRHVVTVMDVLADLGFVSVSIATTPSE
ncbi:Biopolymer transport protein ExbD/TolR [hydrothermal vent metagenome]|uniref:Biopolymer transport protein ExbD/TolR n=1 Tax=hydrothermal vent metagenome TaxID=652676 RepID=A0A3B0VJW5_9ZZZZ